MLNGGEVMGYDTMNSSRELEGSSQISVEECRRAVEEVGSLIASLGAILGGLVSTYFAMFAVIVSLLAVSASILSWREGSLQIIVIYVLVIVLAVIALGSVVLGIEIVRTAPFKHVKASERAIMELLGNRKHVIKRCLDMCGRVTYSVDEGDRLFCLDAEKLLNAINEISKDGFFRLLKRHSTDKT